MRLSRLLVAASAILFAGAQAPPPAELDAAAQRVRGHVEFLAGDLLEGRETGSRGHELAAAYVAAEFRKLGLRPGGTNGGWYVQVPFRRASHAGVPKATLLIGGRRVPLVSGRDFALRPSLTERDRTIDAGLVFVGHGVSDPRAGIDEYAGLDVRGKIVVALDGVPEGLPSDVAAHLESAKDDVAAAKGAIGYIEIASNGRPGRPGPISRRLRPLLDWVDAEGRGARGAVRVDAAITVESASRLFEGSSRSLAAIRNDARRSPVQGFALPARLQVRSRSSWKDFTSPEVVGVLPGSDPAVAGEHIVLTGHLDHLGHVEQVEPGTDSIHNGAIDNAAGIATMLEAARSFVRSGKPTRRSVMFIAHTGEERGLLGAAYYAAHPTVRAGSMVGLVNLDMPLLLYDFTDVIAFGAEHSTIGSSVAAAAESMGVALASDPMPEQALFTRSDHYPFVKQGVPSIFLMTGHANGGKAAWDDFLANTYHTVKDDLGQPIHWRAGARFAELNYRIARALADAPDRPRWYRGSYFGETFSPAQPKAEQP